MRKTAVLFYSLAFVFFFFTAFPRPAHAYLDMGTGSYVIQVVIASLVGVLVALKIYWRKLTGSIAALFKGKKSGEDENKS